MDDESREGSSAPSLLNPENYIKADYVIDTRRSLRSIQLEGRKYRLDDKVPDKRLPDLGYYSRDREWVSENSGKLIEQIVKGTGLGGIDADYVREFGRELAKYGIWSRDVGGDLQIIGQASGSIDPSRDEHDSLNAVIGFHRVIIEAAGVVDDAISSGRPLDSDDMKHLDMAFEASRGQLKAAYGVLGRYNKEAVEKMLAIVEQKELAVLFLWEARKEVVWAQRAGLLQNITGGFSKN